MEDWDNLFIKTDILDGLGIRSSYLSISKEQLYRDFIARMLSEGYIVKPQPELRKSATCEDLTKKSANTRFNEFWTVYPRKVKKKDAEKKWISKKLDDKADLILEDISKRLRADSRWLEGFIPDPTTYLNGERWTDEIQSAKKSEPEVKLAGAHKPYKPSY